MNSSDTVCLSMVPDVASHMTSRCCSVCGSQCADVEGNKCGSCHAVYYCSGACRDEDWIRVGDLAAHSHCLLCHRLQTYMGLEGELANLPFSFANETTKSDFLVDPFLQKQGLLNQGAWVVERMGIMQDPYTAAKRVGSFNEDCIVLPVESTTLDDPITQTAGTPSSWADYYSLRGFQLDSPIAILLHWPLTVFHIIQHRVHIDYPELGSITERKLIVVDIIGVSLETELLPLFRELSALLPMCEFDIHMYGAEVPWCRDGLVYKQGRLSIKVVRGLYHKVVSHDRKTTVAIAFHVGLYVFKTWKKTLDKLQSANIPTYFTEYGHKTYEDSRSAAEGMGFKHMSEPAINPFRSPLRIYQSATCLPWYRNAILFCLKNS
ncbi:zinc finger MYND domain-containing protein 15-like isoform X1 [Dreissena polymorpha]|nr:zinc finger MYND domain-containing protein 15-like isoform X1 [Dreissena polymorpha]